MKKTRKRRHLVKRAKAHLRILKAIERKPRRPRRRTISEYGTAKWPYWDPLRIRRNPRKRKTKVKVKARTKAKTRRVTLRTIISREVLAKNPRKAKATVRILGHAVTVGTKKHAALLAQKKHFDDLARHETGMRRNPRRRKRSFRVVRVFRGKKNRAKIRSGKTSGRVILLVIRPGKYAHTLAGASRDAIRAELAREWGRKAPRFVAAIDKQLAEHGRFEWTKRIMGNVVHFTKV